MACTAGLRSGLSAPDLARVSSTLRVLIGVAEGGLAPGIVLYLSQFATERERAVRPGEHDRVRLHIFRHAPSKQQILQLFCAGLHLGNDLELRGLHVQRIRRLDQQARRAPVWQGPRVQPAKLAPRV